MISKAIFQTMYMYIVIEDQFRFNQIIYIKVMLVNLSSFFLTPQNVCIVAGYLMSHYTPYFQLYNQPKLFKHKKGGGGYGV